MAEHSFTSAAKESVTLALLNHRLLNPFHIDNRQPNRNILQDDYRAAITALMSMPDSHGRDDHWTHTTNIIFKVPGLSGTVLQELIGNHKEYIEDLERRHVTASAAWRNTLEAEAPAMTFGKWRSMVVQPVKVLRDVRYEFEYRCIVLKVMEKLFELVEDSLTDSDAKEKALAIR